MFTTNHFIWLAICAAFILTLLFVSVKFKFSVKTATYVVCGIAAASELCKIFTHIEMNTDESGKLTGGVLEPGALPFHLCSILIFFLFYLMISKNEKRCEAVRSFILPIALLGGLLAIFIPTSGVNFAKPYAYQCFIYHSGILWYALYLLSTKQVKLGFAVYKRNMALLGALVIIMLWVNSLLSIYDTNFFYLVRPPMDNLPILNLNNGWYAYFFTVIAIGITAITLVYLPSFISEYKTKNKM